MGNVSTVDLTGDDKSRPEINSSRIEVSLLDELLELPEVTETRYIDIAVPKRPGYVVRFDDNVSSRDLRSYKKAAARGKSGDVDTTVMNGLLLVDRNVGVFKKIDGALVPIPDEDGEVLKFNSLEFIDKFGVKDGTRDAVVSIRRFLGEAFLVMVGNKVTEFAGWGDKVDTEEEDGGREDPTKG